MLKRAADLTPGQIEVRNGRFDINGLLGEAIEPFPGQPGPEMVDFIIKAYYKEQQIRPLARLRP